MVFADETAVQLAPNVCRTWAPVGRAPVLAHSYKRDRASAIGGLTWNTKTGELDLLAHMHENATIDRERVIDFLRGFRGIAVGPIVLVWDNIKIHHCDIVKRYIADNADWLTVINLPSYSPDLNPIEFLWSAWKRTYLANLCLDNLGQVKDLIFENESALTDKALLQGCIVGSGLATREEVNR